MESLLFTTLEIEKMFGELGEIPYEPLKEEHDEFMNGRRLVVEKQVQVLNESLISLQGR